MTNFIFRRRKSFGRQKVATAGFSMLEMLVAMAMFAVISGSAFGLMAQHQPIFGQQQGMAAVNIAVRNAVAQMQLDIANGGSNYYSGINIPNWPVGIVIVNRIPGANCETSTTAYIYGPSCFDTLNIVASDPNTLPTNPGDGTVGGCHTTTGTTVYLSPSTANPAGSGYPTLAAAATAAANFQYNAGVNPDQLLFVRGDGSLYTTAVLTASATTATVNGRYYVQLAHGATAANGTNASTTNDPLQITVNQDTAAGTYQNTMLAAQFCSGSPTTDYVLRLTPIQYNVSTSNASDPQLTRTQNGTTQVLADQIIGFKVGTTLFNGGSSSDSTAYDFNNSDYQNNYTLVRSVRISLIGRTVPDTSPTYVFRNAFDGGPYQIQGVSVVVNPRNMSMADN
jgi:prepilin-type N-terminal cleavage/methylation domain-containing protein